MTKLRLNKDNVWDNLKITWDYDGSDGKRCFEAHYYKMQNGLSVFYSLDMEENSVIAYKDTSLDDEKFNEAAYSSCSGTMNGEWFTYSDDDVFEVDILEDGSYKITIVTQTFDDLDNEAIVEIKINNQGNIDNMIYYTIVKMGEYGYGLQHVQVNYEYGVLTEAEVQANIDAYNAQQHSN